MGVSTVDAIPLLYDNKKSMIDLAKQLAENEPLDSFDLNDKGLDQGKTASLLLALKESRHVETIKTIPELEEQFYADDFLVGQLVEVVACTSNLEGTSLSFEYETLSTSNVTRLLSSLL